MVWPILNEAQNEALKEIVQTQSDRVAAILGGAMLDDSLRQVLEGRMRPSGINEKMFKINGSLGNMAPKIDLAYLLYVIDDVSLKTMHGLAAVRNFFAHNLTASFESTNSRLAEGLRGLRMHEGRTHYPSPFSGTDSEYELEDTSSRRGLWMVNLKLALGHLMADSDKHMPWSNAPRQAPQLVFPAELPPA
jgi:hypothetical protein